MITYESGLDLIRECLRQKETIIQRELCDLIEKGLLVIEEQEPTLVRVPDKQAFELRQKVSIKLKDHKYIAELESENKKLKEQLAAIKKVVL